MDLPDHLGGALRGGLVADDAPVYRLSGDLDLGAGDALPARIVAMLDDGVTDVVLDLTDVAFVDSTGLAVLIGLQGLAQQRGGSLVLRRPAPTVRRMLSVSGLDALAEPEASAPAG